MMLSLSDASSGTTVGTVGVLGYQFGFEFNALSPLSEAYDGATYENLDYPLSIDIGYFGYIHVCTSGIFLMMMVFK